jgi:urease accessory protein
MPADASGAAFAAGFMLATALLHGTGLALGFAIGRAGEIRGPLVVRAAGAMTALAGVGLLAGLI